MAGDLDDGQEIGRSFRTKPDSYGVYREYAFRKPSITPDAHLTLSDLSDSPYLALNASTQVTSAISISVQKDESTVTEENSNWFAPFENASTYCLMNWFTTVSATKSMTQLDSLVNDVLLASDFNPEELSGFRAAKENARLDSYKFQQGPGTVSDNDGPPVFDDTWIKSTIYIPLPCDGFCQPESEAPMYPIEFYHRKLLDVIKAARSEFESKGFHTFPFKAYWQHSAEPPERVYSESYTADSWNDQFIDLEDSRWDDPNADLNIEAFIIALMIWSDSTALAQFGTASLWPIYLYIGNQSKYIRGKPTSMSAHHLAYLPKVFLCTFFEVQPLILCKLDDEIQEFYMKEFGKHATAAMLTHIRREIAQAVWMLLMDDDFMHAYVYGFLEEMLDGIERLSFPRFLTYSADYPEK